MDGAAALAETIRKLLFQAMLIGGPVSMLLGFGMMFVGGYNPQLKQKGIEIIKWTIIGVIGVGVVATVLWGVVEPILSSGGGSPA